MRSTRKFTVLKEMQNMHWTTAALRDHLRQVKAGGYSFWGTTDVYNAMKTLEKLNKVSKVLENGKVYWQQKG